MLDRVFYVLAYDLSDLQRMVLDEPAGHFKLDRYYISKALDSLDGMVGVVR